jgi:hypothetical protein
MEMQIRTILREHLSIVRMAIIIKNLKVINVDMDVRESEPLYILLVGM